MSDFFDIAEKTVKDYVRAQRRVHGNVSYTLEDTAQVMTRYLLASLARNMHKLTEEQKLRFLPDLLKVKDDIKAEEGLAVTMYTPRKMKIKPEDIIETDEPA